MLPSRPRLESWDPASLGPGGAAVTTAGQYVHDAVSTLDAAYHTLPELNAWSGDAHDAAAAMFGRANAAAAHLSDNAAAVGTATSAGAGPLGDARASLLAKANDIDAGDLWVTDDWVVLIKAAPLSADEAETLADRAVAEQVVVNRFLLAVGDADEETANSIVAAASAHGFEIPRSIIPLPGTSRPADEVPNPQNPMGLYQQALVRSEDMGVTVRETTKHEDAVGNRVTTMHMQDGSRQEHILMNPYRGPVAASVFNDVRVLHYDRNGNEISKSRSWENFEGTKFMTTTWADGTTVHAEEWEDGYKVARVSTADGRTGEIPADSPFFTHPGLTTVGGAMSGLDEYATRGGGIPTLSADDVKKVGVGAKFAGPALGIATAIYDVATADAGQRCEAAISGTFGVVGGAVAGTAGGALGAAAGMGAASAPAAVGGAAVGGTLGSWAGGWVGQKVAGVVCR